MKMILLAAAGAIAAAAISLPAAAHDESSGRTSRHGDFAGQQTFSCFGQGGTNVLVGDRHGDMRQHRDGRRGCNSNVVMDWYGGEWALYNNRSWEPDSYNDWWHDRPDRAYPAWMRRNQDCQRMWYSADTLRC
jgi:hypothetical protein